MLSAIAISALAVGASAQFMDVQRPAITQDLINEVRAKTTSWTPGMNKKFEGATLRDAMMLMGTKLPGEPGYLELPRREMPKRATALPDSFDARTNWPQCQSVIGHVRDQSACGSCWAFGSTEALNDRLCISHGLTTLLSPTDTLACCSGMKCAFSMGCNGGQPSGAWKWFTETGVVTGGDYNDQATCEPYPFPPCAHHVEPTADLPACPSDDYSTPKCASACSVKSYGVDYSKDKHLAKTSYSVRTEQDMMQELVERGTLSVAMTVYEDFLSYTGGVYHHTSGKSLGGHAIKMIGYGVENGTPYWLCVNSWNYAWGDNGTFKIRRGSNECGIEGSVVAGEV